MKETKGKTLRRVSPTWLESVSWHLWSWLCKPRPTKPINKLVLGWSRMRNSRLKFPFMGAKSPNRSVGFTFVNFYYNDENFDNGKPVERQGRKTLDLKMPSTSMIARPPKNLALVCILIRRPGDLTGSFCFLQTNPGNYTRRLLWNMLTTLFCSDGIKRRLGST